MNAILCKGWEDYELVDFGNEMRLDRFGTYHLIRPEPLAKSKPRFSKDKWNELAQVEFIQKSSKEGSWNIRTNIGHPWNIQYDKLSLHFKLDLSAYKHVGLFPEQAANWKYIANCCKKIEVPRVLNLFAYTGAASLAAAGAGAEVTHLDSVKQVISWAKTNMELSGLEGIKWVLEDARKFVAREVKRGNKYNGIILDPPPFGKGAKGENWKLEQDLLPLLKDILRLLDKEYFLILNLYKDRVDTSEAESLFQNFAGNIECAKLGITSTNGNDLIVGDLIRFNNVL